MRVNLLHVQDRINVQYGKRFFGHFDMSDILVFVSKKSKSEIKRTIKQGGLTLNVEVRGLEEL